MHAKYFIEIVLKQQQNIISKYHIKTKNKIPKDQHNNKKTATAVRPKLPKAQMNS